MIAQQALIDQLERKEQVVNKGKLHRILSAPFKYLLIRIIRIRKQSSLQSSMLFFDAPFNVLLPSGIDIYLFGIKTHDSEIRLTKYLIRNLKANDNFFDVGAHFGYFSVMASHLVSATGRVHSFEPSKRTHEVLRSNVNEYANVRTHNVAVGADNKLINFKELPIYYSEYNSIYHDQYEDSNWYGKQKMEEYALPLINLDAFAKEDNIEINVIKMDVEGAEHDVIQGMKNILQNQSPIVIMEFSYNQLNNHAHQKAVRELINLGYSLNRIRNDGLLEGLETETLFEINLDDSDNIVFKKETL